MNMTMTGHQVRSTLDKEEAQQKSAGLVSPDSISLSFIPTSHTQSADSPPRPSPALLPKQHPMLSWGGGQLERRLEVKKSVK